MVQVTSADSVPSGENAGIGAGVGSGVVGVVGAGCSTLEKSLSLPPHAPRSAVSDNAISVRLALKVLSIISNVP